MADETTDALPDPLQAPLTVCVDVAHAECWLTVAPVRALADSLEVDVDWLPFPTPLPRPPQTPPGAPESRGVRHRRLRARYREMDLERYAAAQGLTLRASAPPFDSTLASLGLLWLRERAPERRAAYLHAVCAAYWSGRSTVEHRDAVQQGFDAAGIDAAGFAEFAAGSGPGRLARLREALVAAGVFTVPTLLVEGEPFVGRAHLPMVRWLLTGRTGPPPI
ncbi:MAG TPA: DsbA family protein [Pseudomonadales bacterium]